MPGAPVFVTEVSADRYGEQAPQLAVPDDGTALLPYLLVSFPLLPSQAACLKTCDALHAPSSRRTTAMT